MKFLVYLSLLLFSLVTFGKDLESDTVNIGNKRTSDDVVLKFKDGGYIKKLNTGGFVQSNDGIIEKVIPTESGALPNGTFIKKDYRSVAFIKTSAQTLSIVAKTSAVVNGTTINFSVDTNVIVPTLVAGTDYAVYICQDGTVRASDDFDFPSGYTALNSLKVGGFHYSAVSPTETLVGGEFATTGGGMIWTQPDVDKIRGINQFSFWDNKFRPVADDPRGMVLVAGRFWADIYFTNTDPDTNGTSKYNSNVASGTVLPKKPAMFGGDGTVTYTDGNWWNMAELVRAQGKRLPTFNEFSDLAFGTTEATSLGGASETIPLTKNEKKYTSKWGVEQSTGHMYTWGADIGGATGSASWVADTHSRGSTYAANLSAPLFGGYRADTSNSGSRSSSWSLAPTSSYWNIGVRAVCDHERSE